MAAYGGVQLPGIDGAEVQHLPEGGDGGFRRQGAGGGQLRLRVDDAGDEERDDEVAGAPGAAGEQGGESEPRVTGSNPAGRANSIPDGPAYRSRRSGIGALWAASQPLGGLTASGHL